MDGHAFIPSVEMKRRHALFLFVCIGLRLLFVFLAMTYRTYLTYMGYVAAIISGGFFYIFLTGSRKSGAETGGAPIWWNLWRPIHGALYALFAYSAVTRDPAAWKLLLLDVIVGLFAFMTHY